MTPDPAPAEPPRRGGLFRRILMMFLGTAVAVVTGEQLRAQQVRNGGDALRALPGAAVSRTGCVSPTLLARASLQTVSTLPASSRARASCTAVR